MGMTEKQAMEFVAELIGAQNQVIEKLKLENKLSLSRLEGEQDKNEILKKINADLQKSYNEVNEKYLKADNYANEQKNRADKLEEENKQALQANDLLGRLNDGLIKDLEKKEKLVELKAETAETTTTAEILTVLKEIHQHLIGGNPVMAANAKRVEQSPKSVKLSDFPKVQNSVTDDLLDVAFKEKEAESDFFQQPQFESIANKAQKDEDQTYLEKSREKLYVALGEASSCWENLEGAGVFESTRCGEIGERLENQFFGLPHAIAVLTHHLKTDTEFRSSWRDTIAICFEEYIDKAQPCSKVSLKKVCNNAAELWIEKVFN